MPDNIQAIGRRTVLAAAASLAVPGWAQSFPSRPVKLVIPFPPGGSTDAAGRLLAEEMAKFLGQPVVVDNRVGNAGAIGIAAVAKSPPDGYTVGLSGSGPTVIGRLVGQPLGYEDREISVLGTVGTLELVFVARPDFPAQTMSEVIRLAKASPGKFNYASAGYGGPIHLAFEYLKVAAGIDLKHIPYKGDAPALTDLMGGQVDLGMLSAPAALPQIKAGKVKGLAVGGKVRLKQAPDMPTVQESALPGWEAATWNVLVGPAGMPAAARTRLNAALNAALNSAVVRERFPELGMTPMPGTPAEAEAFVAAERAKWGRVTSLPGIKLSE